MPTPTPKVLVVISSLSHGGSEHVVSNMVNFWADRKRNIGLLTLTNKPQDHYKLDARVQRFRLQLTWNSPNRWQGLRSNIHRLHMIRMAVRKLAPDVVVSFIDHTNIMVLAALLGLKIPVLVCERVDPREYSISLARRLARRLLYPFAAATVVQTRSVAHWARGVVPDKKVEVIPNAIGELPEPCSWFDREQLIVAVGRLAPQKGFDILIEAFAYSKARSNDWKLIILGEGSERAHLERIVTRHEMYNQVRLAGTVFEPWRWLNRARLFVLPSRFEGFPNALLEAMAMGCACIATDCCSGPAEIVASGVNGALVPVDDVTALTATIDKLIAEPRQAALLAREALKIRRRFDTNSIMSQWDDLIRSVVQSTSTETKT